MLTKNQNHAVLAGKGNFLINAGAGSGKTTVFTGRIATLIKRGDALPAQILGLTFTNEAANSMRSKLKKLTSKHEAEEVILSTFHSFAYQLLRENFSIEYASKSIAQDWWKLNMASAMTKPASRENPYGLSLTARPMDMVSFISYQKMNMIDDEHDVIIDAKTEDFRKFNIDDLNKMYRNFIEAQKNARLIDFDDMLLDLYHKLKTNQLFRKRVQERFEYIMIDEFQDTNKVSMEIIKLISRNNLFVVGDFRQGIYGFNNANIDNILKFNEEFENVETIQLLDNFRSTKNIVEISNLVIDASPIDEYKKFDRQIAARDEVGSPVRISVFQTEYDEALNIAHSISDEISDGASPTDFAILTRTNAQLGLYESIFSELKIPVKNSSGRSFFDKYEIDAILKYAEHTLNPDDDNSIRRVLNTPNRFISNAAIMEVDKVASSKKMSIEDTILKSDFGRNTTRLNSVVMLFDDLRDYVEHLNAYKFLSMIIDKTHYRAHIIKSGKTQMDIENSLSSIDTLLEIAKKFSSTKQLLMHIAMVKDNNKNKNQKAVSLMTVHASKGLEFETVYAPSTTDKNYPHDMNSDFEEERRLFYVLLSRAKNKLFISMPCFGKSPSDIVNVSPYVLSIGKISDSLLKLRRNVITGANEYNYVNFDI